jgi:hypothetical protein
VVFIASAATTGVKIRTIGASSVGSLGDEILVSSCGCFGADVTDIGSTYEEFVRMLI